ncbi:MAG TPA: hypothetical protein DCZ12_12235 [Gammaproteobacteria bacterium]|nr:hypothetical protein [Gammaproteobacteria bacterium]HBA34893.1 hypothetical protein [Gammaproteobacteria bacterium]
MSDHFPDYFKQQATIKQISTEARLQIAPSEKALRKCLSLDGVYILSRFTLLEIRYLFIDGYQRFVLEPFQKLIFNAPRDQPVSKPNH